MTSQTRAITQVWTIVLVLALAFAAMTATAEIAWADETSEPPTQRSVAATAADASLHLHGMDDGDLTTESTQTEGGGVAVSDEPEQADQKLAARQTMMAQDANITGAELAQEADDVLLEDGVYEVQSMVDTKLVLDVFGGSKDGGANVQIYSSNNTNAQKWFVTYKDGFYTLQSLVSGLVLDINGGSTRNGANAQQYSPNNTNAQKWKLEALEDGQFTIISALDPKFVLDVSGGTARNGANVQGYRSNGTAAQKWRFKLLETMSCDRIIEDGVYEVSSSLGNNLVLDISAGSYNDNANAQVWTSNKTNAQRWAFTWDSETKTYSIRNAANAKALDVSGGNARPGTNVQQYSANGTAAQRWVLKRAGDFLTIMSAASGMALDVSGASRKAGTNVQTYSPNGTAAQKWTLKKADGALADGLYNIYSMLAPTTRVIDANSAANEAGGSFYSSKMDNGFDQKFRLTRVSGDDYTLQVLDSGKYVTNVNGALVQAVKSGGADQHWAILFDSNGLRLTSASQRDASIEVSDGVFETAENEPELVIAATVHADKQHFRFQTVNLLSNGFYVLRNANSGMALDISSASRASCANAQQYTVNGTKAQLFYIESSGENYRLMNANSFKALDVANGSKRAGANVQQYAWNGTAAQLWSATLDAGGRLVFKNKGSGMALEVADGSITSGANVRQASPASGAARQQWIAEPTLVTGDATLDRYIGGILCSHSTLRDAYEYVSRIPFKDGYMFESGKYLDDDTTRSLAKAIVERNYGNCFNTSSLLSWIARTLGYDTNVTVGWIPSVSRGKGLHGWIELYATGGPFIIDPSMYRGISNRNWYMVTYAEAPTEYHFW